MQIVLPQAIVVQERYKGAASKAGTASGTATEVDVVLLLGGAKPAAVWVTNRDGTNELVVYTKVGATLHIPPYTVWPMPMPIDWLSITGSGNYNVTAFAASE